MLYSYAENPSMTISEAEALLEESGSLTHNFSHIITREASSLFFLSNLFSIFVVYISKYHRYETCN